MPDIDRPLSGTALLIRLGGSGRSGWIDESLLARAGRSARTLIKDGALRVTLVALAPGGMLREHHADGPIIVQVLSGAIRFRVSEEMWDLVEGDLLSLAAGVSHAVESVTGGEFLLTLATKAES